MRVCRFLVLLVAFAAVDRLRASAGAAVCGVPVVRSDLDMMTYGAPAAYRQPPMYGPSSGQVLVQATAHHRPLMVRRRTIAHRALRHAIRSGARNAGGPRALHARHRRQAAHRRVRPGHLEQHLYGRCRRHGHHAADRRGAGARHDHRGAVRRDQSGSPAASSASPASRSRSTSTGRSSCSARSPIRASTPTCPT